MDMCRENRLGQYMRLIAADPYTYKGVFNKEPLIIRGWRV